MPLLLCAGPMAWAGDLYVVHWAPEGLEYELVATTKTGDGVIVTAPDQPIDLMVLADLSDSIGDEEAHQMALTLETLYDELKLHAVPGDRFGVTAFAAKPQRWIPLGSLQREGIRAWLDRFGLPKLSWATPLELGEDPDAVPVPPDVRVLDRGETDAARALNSVTDDLRKNERHALQVIVVLWDGGHNGFGNIERALDRAWAHEVHIWSVAFERPSGPLLTRGAGDAYVVVGDCGPMVAEKIAAEIRFQGDPP